MATSYGQGNDFQIPIITHTSARPYGQHCQAELLEVLQVCVDSQKWSNVQNLAGIEMQSFVDACG